MRTPLVVLILVPSFALGCRTPAPEPSAPAEPAPLMTLDGLAKRDIDVPGVLYIREAHQIGSYDRFQISIPPITYKRRSSKLPAELEEQFMARLEQSLAEATAASDIPVVQAPGPCVLRIAIGLTDVDILEDPADTLAEMALVMEFWDSDSGQSLLRYVARGRVENRGDDIPWTDQISDSFDEMVLAMNIGVPLRKSGLMDEPIRPGCEGTIAERGRAATEAAEAVAAP